MESESEGDFHLEGANTESDAGKKERRMQDPLSRYDYLDLEKFSTTTWTEATKSQKRHLRIGASTTISYTEKY